MGARRVHTNIHTHTEKHEALSLCSEDCLTKSELEVNIRKRPLSLSPSILPTNKFMNVSLQPDTCAVEIVLIITIFVRCLQHKHYVLHYLSILLFYLFRKSGSYKYFLFFFYLLLKG